MHTYICIYVHTFVLCIVYSYNQRLVLSLSKIPFILTYSRATDQSSYKHLVKVNALFLCIGCSYALAFPDVVRTII